jgi:hypothetical protein
MRRVLFAVALVALGACRSTSGSGAKAAPGDIITAPAPAGTPATVNPAGGTSSAQGSVEAFLTAVKKQDLQTMSMIWGTEKGLARDQMSREDLEKRLIIMQCSLNHDSWKFVPLIGTTTRPNEQDFRVELQQKNLREQTIVTTVRGVGSRWYVMNADITKLTNFCR